MPFAASLNDHPPAPNVSRRLIDGAFVCVMTVCSSCRYQKAIRVQLAILLLIKVNLNSILGTEVLPAYQGRRVS